MTPYAEIKRDHPMTAQAANRLLDDIHTLAFASHGRSTRTDIVAAAWRAFGTVPRDTHASGAYMPAVTYYSARQTMADYGDEVLQYIEDARGELPRPRDGISWSEIAVHYLSAAVEIWACGEATEAEVMDAAEPDETTHYKGA